MAQGVRAAPLLVGIDAGGTFTDLVCFRDSAEPLGSVKVATDHDDLARTVAEGLDGLLKDFPDATVGSVHLATTLATNAIVEGKLRRTGLILIGYDRRRWEEAFADVVPAGRVAFVAGGHDLAGDEKEPLDEEALDRELLSLAGSVDGLALSAFFSVRNPAHEIRARSRARELLKGLPVTCGHELSQELDAYLRAATAVLNAGLIPPLVELLDGVEKAMARRAIEGPLMVVRGDGSLVGASWARLHPVETILSGPAAGAVGGAFLARREGGLGEGTWVVDMGGTTTDIVRVDERGLPALSVRGASVGSHRTLVKAIDIRTVGLGGDSRVTVEGEDLSVGPGRVIPLSVLAASCPDVRCRLEARLAAAQGAEEPLFLLPGPRLKESSLCLDGPVLLGDHLAKASFSRLARREAERLEKEGVVRFAGFTPTDALHLTGELRRGDGKASRFGAALLLGGGKGDGKGLEAFGRRVVREVSRLVALEVFTKALADGGLSLSGEGRALLKATATESGAGPSLQMRLGGAVAAVGAPAGAFAPLAGDLLGCRAGVFVHSPVAGAVGAALAVTHYRYAVFIRPRGKELFCVHLPQGRRDFADLEEAVAWTERFMTSWVRERACEAGSRRPLVTVEREDLEALISAGSARLYLGTYLSFRAEEGEA